MFSCGIGSLSKKLLSRKKHRNSVTLPIAEESLPTTDSDTESLNFGSCSSVDEPIDRIEWSGEQSGIKRGYCVKSRIVSKPMRVNPDDVQFGDTLGRGTSGTVYKGYLESQEVAIKKIRPETKEHGLQTEPFELHMGQIFRHPNLIKVLGVHIDEEKTTITSTDSETVDHQVEDHGKEQEEEHYYETPSGVHRSSSSLFSDMAQNLSEASAEEIWIVMEYCNKGTLREAIKNGEFFEDIEKKRLRILHILLSSLEIAAALDHLHSFGIIHGDLKSQNVLLMSSDILAKNFVCKVGDFGMSRPLTQIKTHISTFTAGTISHMPPEVLRDGILTPAADVFSFGMLLWELMAGEIPFLGMNSGEIMIAIVEGQRPEIPDHWPPTYTHLIKSCWNPRRDQRPTFKNIIIHIKKMLGGPVLEESKTIPVLTSQSTTTLTDPTCSSELFSTEGDNGISFMMTADLNEPVIPSLQQEDSSTVDKPKEESKQQISQIPKPPRISVISEATSKVQPITELKRKPFPQWQAYLDAINEQHPGIKQRGTSHFPSINLRSPKYHRN